MMVQLPSVLLIGAQKSGTSAIADWLFEGGFYRPRVFGNEPQYYSKEPHFFDNDMRFHKGLEFYARRFQHEGKDVPTLDATPDTMQYAKRVRDIYHSARGNQVNHVKLIAILRDPIARELSLYNHLAYDCRNLELSQLTSWHKQVTRPDGSIMSFNEFVDCVSIPALTRDNQDTDRSGMSSRHGLYATHLQKWFDLFSRRNQILILSYDELCKNPQNLQERIQKFVGRAIPGNICWANSNNSRDKVQTPSSEARQRLIAVMRPHNKRLYELLDAQPGPPMEQRPFPKFDG